MSETLRDLADLGAERAFLGACMIDGDAIDKCEGKIREADFYWEGHRIVYRALEHLREGQSPIDLMTVTRVIGKDTLDQVHSGNERKGYLYLVDMVDATPTSMHVVHYAEIVSRLSTLRQLQDFACSVAETAYSAGNVQLNGIFDNIRAHLDEIAPEVESEHILYWKDSINMLPALQDLRRREAEELKAGTRKPRPALPWYALKLFVKNWLHKGSLTVVAAESSVGKTAMLECFAEYWASLGLQVAFFHLELSHSTMIDRRTARWSGVPLEEIECGVENEKTAKAENRIRSWPGGIHYVHCPGWSAQRIAQHARMLRNKGKCDVLIVDYFQKIRVVHRSGMNRAQARGADAEILKTLGEQEGMCVVIASQFSRLSYGEKRKTGKNLRDTGELEEKANLVITIERPILNQDYEENGLIIKAGNRSPSATVRIDKNTYGPTGEGQLYFIGPRFFFRDPFKGKKKEPLNF